MSDQKWENLANDLNGGQLPRHLYSGVLLNQFAVLDGLLYYIREEKEGGWIYTLVIPEDLKLAAMKYAHELVGHLGQLKTIRKAEEYFYWVSLRQDICTFVKTCETC